MNFVSTEHKGMSIKKQCKLLEVPRSSYYRPSADPKRTDETLMRAIDRIATEEPTFGVKRMVDALETRGFGDRHHRVRRIMREMGLEPIYPKPRLSQAAKGHKVYPYLLRKLAINRSDQVWCADITYIPMEGTHVYLCAVMDWYSRRIISWRLSNTLDADFCIKALEEAIALEGCPEIFNTDQGCQFTCQQWLDVLRKHQIKISMDGKGRALDNRMIERFWRSLKYDDIYIYAYETMPQLRQGLQCFIGKYNRRNHQGIDMSPEDCYQQSKPPPLAA